MLLDIPYLRDEWRDKTFGNIRVSFKLLCADETIDGEVDRCVDPWLVVRENRATENG